MKPEKENILELEIGLSKQREEIKALESDREQEMQIIQNNYETQLAPLREQLATDEKALKQKLLALT